MSTSPSEAPADAERATLHPALMAVAVGAWLAYLVLLPVLVAHQGAGWLLLTPTLGVWLFSWLAHIRHWCFHRYFRGVDNMAGFKLVSFALFANPAIFAAAHKLHHKHVHTPRDIEFFCEGWEDWRRRRRMFLLELVLGNIAWEFATEAALRRAGLIEGGRLWPFVRRVLSLLALAGCTWLIAPQALLTFFLCYGLTLYAGALITRHNQWLEHLGILGEGASLDERNRMTRSLDLSTPGGRLFAFINHDDARDHVLHHLEARTFTQDGRTPPPVGSPMIRLSQYPAMLRDYYRTWLAEPRTSREDTRAA